MSLDFVTLPVRKYWKSPTSLDRGQRVVLRQWEVAGIHFRDINFQLQQLSSFLECVYYKTYIVMYVLETPADAIMLRRDVGQAI
jgi:hypothetical protein